MKRSQSEPRTFSRRQFLSRAPLALAGGLIIGSVTGRLLAGLLGRKRGYPVFREGSIFTPARDQRRDL